MEQTPTRYEALLKAVEAAGSQTQFAKAIGMTQAGVWKMLRSSKQLPAEHVLLVERLFGVSRHDLRPDLYPRGLIDGQPFGGRFMGVDMPAGDRFLARTGTDG